MTEAIIDHRSPSLENPVIIVVNPLRTLLSGRERGYPGGRVGKQRRSIRWLRDPEPAFLRIVSPFLVSGISKPCPGCQSDPPRERMKRWAPKSTKKKSGAADPHVTGCRAQTGKGNSATLHSSLRTPSAPTPQLFFPRSPHNQSRN